jgi:hypothetical protein
MAAFSTPVQVYKVPAPAGGDGLCMAFGTVVPTASYDTSGSTINFSTIFADECVYVHFLVPNADYEFVFMPTATTYATATGKVFATDNAGTEIANTTDLATALTSVYWFAIGKDA